MEERKNRNYDRRTRSRGVMLAPTPRRRKTYSKGATP